MVDLCIRQSVLLEEPSSQLNSFVADFDTDHGALGADPLRQKPQAASRPASDLDYSRAVTNSDLVEELRRLGRQLLGLSLQALLLVRGVAEEVLIALCRHPRPPPCGRSYAS